jgi:hypothetical protein
VDEQYIYRERHSAEEYYERPELTRLRADAKAHKFALVVVHSVERLARDAIHLGIIDSPRHHRFTSASSSKSSTVSASKCTS